MNYELSVYWDTQAVCVHAYVCVREREEET